MSVLGGILLSTGAFLQLSKDDKNSARVFPRARVVFELHSSNITSLKQSVLFMQDMFRVYGSVL